MPFGTRGELKICAELYKPIGNKRGDAWMTAKGSAHQKPFPPLMTDGATATNGLL